MANIENIFRFISLRPTKQERVKGRLNMHVYGENSKSPLYREMAKLSASGASKEELARIGNNYQKAGTYITDFRELKYPVSNMLDWVAAHGQEDFKTSDFLKQMLQIAGKNTLDDLVKDQAFQDAYNNLCDSVLADILSGTTVADREDKITSIKILYTLKAVAEKKLVLNDTELLDEFFGRSTVVFPLYRTKPGEGQQREPDPGPSDKEKEREKERKAREEKLANLERAHRELSMMAKDEKYRLNPEAVNVQSDRIRDLENQVVALANKCKDHEPEAPAPAAATLGVGVIPAQKEFILSPNAYNYLHENTRTVLADFHFETGAVNPVVAVNRIEEEISHIHSQTVSEATYNRMVPLGGVMVNQAKFMQSFGGMMASGAAALGAFIKKCAFKAGIGDLLIVRQKLKAYELAEFAHVENALSGEFRERVHKRLDLTEVITTTATETETEKERNLQSTERNEMQTEAEKVVQQQAHVDAGLQVSGSYGPSVSFSASLSAGFSSSVQETQKKSTSYSREVTEKTSEKVRTKVTEEQRRRTLQQIEESNTHRIDNTAAGAKHVRGIYRWLNKIYDAQIYNYGQRMMYEFVIPEPAAFFLYATVEHAPEDSNIIKPDLPTFPIWGTVPLKPANLTRTNYHDYVSKYNVTNAPEPPSQFVVKTFSDKLDGKDGVNIGRSGAIAIPDGYEGYAAMISYNSIFEEGSKNFARIMIGGLSMDRNYWGAEYRNFSQRYRGEVTITASLMNKWSFALGVDVFCTITDEAFSKWQIKMYDAIMQAYFAQKSVYDAKMEQKDIQKGVEILGRNPLENRRIEKEELKKLVIMILTNNPYPNINSYLNTAEPILDLAKVCPNGSYIRFFENAFEWENILYVFYPYFWGRHAKWINALHITDPDLDFAAFLKAGAARVQVPVRPGFEKAVAFYCQTGMIWEGNDVPLIGDDLYVPIIKEITENLGKLDDGVYYPDPNTPSPWEVTIPTSLVVLQDLKEIPGIVDMMTKQPININP